MKAIEVANELKKIVAAMEANPELEIPKAYVFFSSSPTVEQFKNVARQILPRPLKKTLKGQETIYAEIEVEYGTPGMLAWITIPQSKTCRLVSPAIPAKYECDPILSPEEDAEIAAEVMA